VAMDTYKQLTLEDREKLFIYKTQGLSLRSIAKRLGKCHSTISRELKRNHSDLEPAWYQPYDAQKKYKRRKFRPSNYKILKHWDLQRYVDFHLRQRWSPEIIAGRLPLDHPELFISHETIYRFIYAKDPSLIPYLARRHSRRRKRFLSRRPKSLPIPNRIGIDQRPDFINHRTQFGHWEADSMVSRSNTSAFHVLLERKSRYVKITKIPANNSNTVATTIISRLGDHPTFVRRSITYDNGPENYLHSRVNNVLASFSFFCHPYNSWQKGSVENVIGLIRRFIPKKSDLQKISYSDVSTIEYLLNARPRKCLNFKTPKEVFTHFLSGAVEM
jgi:IS30 family transposase